MGWLEGVSRSSARLTAGIDWLPHLHNQKDPPRPTGLRRAGLLAGCSGESDSTTARRSALSPSIPAPAGQSIDGDGGPRRRNARKSWMSAAPRSQDSTHASAIGRGMPSPTRRSRVAALRAAKMRSGSARRDTRAGYRGGHDKFSVAARFAARTRRVRTARRRPRGFGLCAGVRRDPAEDETLDRRAVVPLWWQEMGKEDPPPAATAIVEPRHRVLPWSDRPGTSEARSTLTVARRSAA
jgi:hypothetical protein